MHAALQSVVGQVSSVFSAGWAHCVVRKGVANRGYAFCRRHHVRISTHLVETR